MARSLERRIAALQTRQRQATPRMVAWLDTGEHGTDSTVQLCVPGGGGERMTRDEWRRRYPNGMLIAFVYGDSPPDDTDNGTF